MFSCAKLAFYLFFCSCSLAFVTAQAQDRCQELIGTCEYYSCIDQERLSCGDTGYALGYGQPYCEKFSAIDFRPSQDNNEKEVFPEAGNDWRDQVRSCLQEEMEEYFASDAPQDCSSLRSFAFASHPKCYTSGPSFCALKPQSVIRIGLTIQLSELRLAETQRQVRDTAKICVAQLQERIDQETRPFIRWNLLEYQNIWRLVSSEPKQLGKLLEKYRLPSEN